MNVARVRAYALAPVCTLLSAAGFFLSFGLGDLWWLAWLAPVPVLWYAFGTEQAWRPFIAASLAMALGGCNLFQAYGGILPVPILALAIGAPALSFAASVLGARRVLRALGPLAAMFAFAALWTAFDLLASFSHEGGTVGTPAASQVAAPLLIQTASLVGFLGITFLLGLVPAGMALGLRARSPLAAGIAVAAFAANAAYGQWRMTEAPTASLRVALVESDAAVASVQQADATAALQAVDDYAANIAALREAQVRLIVLPENIARLEAPAREQAQARLAAAANRAQATVVAGFNTQTDAGRQNVAWVFTPGAVQVSSYAKRHLVPGLESTRYQPGLAAFAANGIGIEICKDMDFPTTLRADMVASRATLLAVPAWDFGADAWSHARVAILRSVENAVPLARAARDGLLSVNDGYGRLLGRAQSKDGFTVLVADVPLGTSGGRTLYDRIGDVFGWFCVALGAVLIAWAMRRER